MRPAILFLADFFEEDTYMCPCVCESVCVRACLRVCLRACVCLRVFVEVLMRISNKHYDNFLFLLGVCEALYCGFVVVIVVC